MPKSDPDFNRCMQCYELQPDCICDEDDEDDEDDEAHGQKKLGVDEGIDMW